MMVMLSLWSTIANVFDIAHFNDFMVQLWGTFPFIVKSLIAACFCIFLLFGLFKWVD